ncbi:MAG: hypothetical protein ACPG4Z_07000 [Chitinophagales bacterium]
MKNVISIIINAILTGILAIVVLVFGNILYLDVFGEYSSSEDAFLAFGITLFLTSLMIGVIHVAIYLPSLFLFKNFITENPIEKVFQKFIPVLFGLFLVYVWIALMAILEMGGSSDEEMIPVILIFGLCQYIIHSAGLYLLLSRVKDNIENEVVAVVENV